MLPDLKEFIPSLNQAWNAQDLDRILEHYSEDFELLSPIAKSRLGLEDGAVKGKVKVREWWQRVLTKVPDLHADLTTRERVTLQTTPEACQMCHAMINPLGFTLEHFDAVGRFRKEEHGKPIDASPMNRKKHASKGVCLAMPPNEPSWVLCCRE